MTVMVVKMMMVAIVIKIMTMVMLIKMKDILAAICYETERQEWLKGNWSVTCSHLIDHMTIVIMRVISDDHSHNDSE